MTIRDIARRAGLALSTVSYALRNHARIPEETRRRVQALAREMNYRPNPRVASLMAHIRRTQSRLAEECIAFIWMHTTRAQASRHPFLLKAFEGAKQRAEQTGFALEEFSTNEPRMNDRRLQQILHARGIVGVVLSPVHTSETVLTLDWDWSLFAPAVIGNVSWTPELHHAGHHHFLAMRLVLEELQKMGCRRPIALIEASSNQRSKRAWEAAFLAHHPTAKNARPLVKIILAAEIGSQAKWMAASGADALIVSEEALLGIAGVREMVEKMKLPVVSLYWSAAAPKALGGIDQGYDRIAMHAIDLVVAQLNNNETGIPDFPRIMLFPGRWVPPMREPT